MSARWNPPRRALAAPRKPEVLLVLLLACLTPALRAGPPPDGQPFARVGRSGGSGILVFPTRLVLGDRRRAGTMTLTNVGSPATYRISLNRMEMDENGGIRDLGPATDQTLIQFSPRQAALGPKGVQVVRILVREPADLPAGEYRFHLVAREEAPPPPEPGSAPARKGISVRLDSLFGIAIPVIVRHGEGSAQVKLAGLALGDDRKELAFRAERSGSHSVYGDFKVTFQAPGKAPVLLGEMNGVAVYAPDPAFRKVRIALGQPVPAGPGRLHVTYTDAEDSGHTLLAEGDLALP